MAPKEPVIEQRADESQRWKQGAARALRRKRRADWLQHVRQGGALGFADWGVAFQESAWAGEFSFASEAAVLAAAASRVAFAAPSRSQPPTAPRRSARLRDKQSRQQLRRPSQTLAPPWGTAAAGTAAAAAAAV